MAATLCRPIRATTTNPSPDMEPNTSTLPYIRNFSKCSANNPNIRKSVSTWGPLHKSLHWKNISFKSCSRDSGHGGSEQEDSPRSHIVLNDPNNHLTCNTKDVRHILQGSQDFGEYKIQDAGMQINKHLPLPHGHNTRKRNGGANLIQNQWGHHTYTEIYDAQSRRGLVPEDDPVYEEIDRNEIQVSDMSDEDGRRQSDMSRQSSRSYGDHRPLIPYSPGNDKSFLDMMSNKQYALDINLCSPNNIDSYRRRSNMSSYRPGIGDAGAVRSLAAVLDGETVVCHLEPPEIYPNDTYVSRTLVLPPYSES